MYRHASGHAYGRAFRHVYRHGKVPNEGSDCCGLCAKACVRKGMRVYRHVHLDMWDGRERRVRSLSPARMCMHICLDVCLEMYLDMGLDICIDVCIDVCMHICIDVCLDMCADMCIDMCINMCTDMWEGSERTGRSSQW